MEFSTNIFTVEEAARYLKIPISSIYKLAQEGKIPAQKVGKHWRFHRNTLDQWIAGGINFDIKFEEKPKKGLDFS
jgi:excisionase family DNA binding protein